MIRRSVHLSIVLVYVTIIVALSLMPGSDSEPLFPHIDKVLHLLAYAGLACICLPLSWTVSRDSRVLIILLVVMWLFSASMEIAQNYVPKRDASWLDLLANSLGLVIGWTTISGIKKARKVRAFFGAD